MAPVAKGQVEQLLSQLRLAQAEREVALADEQNDLDPARCISPGSFHAR